MAVKTIRVPKTPRQAFNKQRPVSKLLKAHIANLEVAAYGPAGPATPPKRPRNEGQASAYIEALTKQLHPEGVAASAPNPDARRLLQTGKAGSRGKRKLTRRAGTKKR